MYLSDYDPDEPPVATHDMEADRLFGVAFQRILTLLLVSLLIGVDFWNTGLLQLAGDRPLAAVLLGALLLRALWSALRSVEHMLADLRDGDGLL